jgi:photosystem II stability/assembly factor-like uncharacterized protein
VSGEGDYQLVAAESLEVTVSFDPEAGDAGPRSCIIGTGCEDVHVSGELFPKWAPITLDQCPGVPNNVVLSPETHLANVALASSDSWWVIGYTDYRVFPEDQRNYLLGSFEYGYECGLADLDSLSEFINPLGIALAGNTGFIVGSWGVIVRVDIDVVMVAPVVITHVFDAPVILRDVSMVDGSRAMSVGDGGTVVITTNGGDTWDATTTGVADLTGVSLVTTDVAVAVGKSGTLVRTTDGGSTWTHFVVASVDFYGIDFVDNNTGIVVGGGGTVYRTTDGGETWVSKSLATTDDLYGVSFVNANDGVVVGGHVVSSRPQDDGPGSIWRTFDGGDTWLQEQATPSAEVLTSVKLLNARTGVAVGFGGTLLVLR